MKVKKFDNLWLMGIILCFALLITIYVFKIFFPSIVIEIAQIESITKIGHYIDTHKWAWYLVTGLLSYLTYYLMCCACSNRKWLYLKDNIIILITIVVLFLVQKFLPKQYTVLNYLSIITVPYLCMGKFSNTVIYTIGTNLLQTITLEIRGLNTMIANYNFATFTILTIDYYILAVLFYFLYNYKKGGYI